jgi:hydrogenase-4 component B
MLLILLPVIPLLGAFALFGTRRTKGKGINSPFIVSSLTLFLGGLALRGVFGGNPLTYRLPVSGPYVPTFRADALSATFVLLAAFLWWVVSIYSPEYMKKEGRARSFDTSTLLTLSAVLGVFLAGDLFTLLLFFELMTITSFFWVVHRQDEQAIQAGYFYLFFSIAGGLLLALGIVLLGTATCSLPAVGTGPVTPLKPQAFSWGLAVIVAGFGIKAGMAPLHLWLPYAHSVAPTPASALLSGLLIKVGAYGLIRTGELAGWGLEFGSAATWLGPALTILGACTMLIGVLAALLQSDAKRLLAYHSISQMGYIILGLGVGLYLGEAGGLGLIGGIYHIVNHALFKAALFLGVGVIYIRTGETNLYNLGGLWRRFPITAVLMFLAVLGITGAPGLNGYASKTLLHHAVSGAAQTGLPLMVWAERLFLLVGVGTAASFTKLFYLIFLARPAEIEISGGKSQRFHVSMAVLAVAMVGIGLWPELFPKALAVPAAQALGMETAAATMAGLSFRNANDVVGMLITLGLGVVVCHVGLATGAFHRTPPRWLTLEGLGKNVRHGLAVAFRTGEESYLLAIAHISKVRGAIKSRRLSACRRLDHSGDRAIGCVTLAGISADAAILLVTLAVLIVCCTRLDLGAPGLRLPSPFPTWMRISLYRW